MVRLATCDWTKTMSSSADKPRPEREQTNESLRIERETTDEKLADELALAQATADAVVKRARGRADSVLKEARGGADEKLREGGATRNQRATVSLERSQADSSLNQERSEADGELAFERNAVKAATTQLLAAERQETDVTLGVERAGSDGALAARDDFMSMVSHDLRTMLTGITMNASTQIKRARRDEAGEPYLKSAEKILRFATRMNRLIGDLVDVASVEAGRLSVAPTTRDAVALAREAIEAFRLIALDKGLTLTGELPDRMVPALVDHDRVLQVLSNLLGNAIKFTASGGHVRLEVKPLANEISFLVIDTGPGIAHDKLQAVFERFWQVDPLDKRGMGLGLFISKFIVEAHGGRIWAESEAGRGSTFAFTLPCPVTANAPG